MILKSTVATFHKTQDNGNVTGLRKLLEMLQQAQDATDYNIRKGMLKNFEKFIPKPNQTNSERFTSNLEKFGLSNINVQHVIEKGLESLLLE